MNQLTQESISGIAVAIEDAKNYKPVSGEDARQNAMARTNLEYAMLHLKNRDRVASGDNQMEYN